MKACILLLCLAVAAVGAEKNCRKSSECEEDECCVNYTILGTFGGRCKKLRDEGESCTPVQKKGDETPDMYLFKCPCKQGMSCEATQELEIFGHVVKMRPECVVGGQTTVGVLETDAPDIEIPEGEQ